MGYEDAVAGYTFLRNHEFVGKTRIEVLSGSFGGYQGTILASEYDVKSLILSAPAVYQDE